MDLIERQAAIDAFEDTTFTKNEIRRRLSELPSAQKEIVKCKDCKFANSLKIGIVCRNMSHPVTENDFCSRAERRTDE